MEAIFKIKRELICGDIGKKIIKHNRIKKVLIKNNKLPW